MRLGEFLSYLRSKEIKLWVEGDKLCYSAPNGALTPPLAAELAERKAEILKVMKATKVAASPILRTSRDKDLPLSFAQQRLWFLDQLEPNSSVYNVPIALRLSGPLNVASLEQSLNEIVRRHEALRTTFPTIEGQPVQLISPSLLLSLPVVDLTDLPASERENEALRLANEEAQRPFDLARGPLLRATLFRVAPEGRVLLLTLHHIVSDEWSQGVLYRELTALYEAFSRGRSSPLPELPIQYIDFARWQHDRLQREEFEPQLSYWKERLRGIATLQLPTDRPRPTAQSSRGARQSIVLPKELTPAIKALSRRQRVTLFMTLLTVFKVLLHRYTGQEDIVVGSAIANRSRVEFEPLIGFFLNTLALRTDLSGNPSFLKLLARVREVAFDAYAHQDLPFEKLVEELQPERILSRNPLFQVLFVLQTYAEHDLELPGLKVSRVSTESHTTKFDLSLFIADTEQGLVGTAQYSTDLFDADTIRRMLEHFRSLLEGIVANPEQPISDLPLLPQSEQRRLLTEWNDTSTEYPRHFCVHEMFDVQVARTPHAIAAVFNDEQLSYLALNERANQLAHRLQRLGVGPEVTAGICMERSLEVVVAVLAVLKAGGAYLPLDPEYPSERLAFMLEDARASVLLTENRFAERLPPHTAQVLYMDAEQDLTTEESRQNPAGDVTAENLAYVIYTSGSTGKPKAVGMRHAALTNLIAWQQQNFRDPAPAKTLQFAPLSFDVSFQEIFTTLCSGGTLLLIPEELRRDAAGLLQRLSEKSVERLLLPFVALQRLAEAAAEEAVLLPHLREIITAGERLQITPQIAAWFSTLKDCPLGNQYGPSESHVVTSFALTGSPSDWLRLPPIGRPIANARIYILDRRLRPAPIGIPGELYIGGPCLARGYLNRPDLTAEKFIPNPFAADPGARLYKTGDLARYLHDGNIEFLGRIDHQVKIRGFRIELGEIESVLAQHPAVLETVVAAREETPAVKRLVAYVVPRADLPPSTSELRSFLKEKLPDYMVPSAFVLLDRLPLNPNGKVDRKALPAPDQSRPELLDSFVPPRTPAEKGLAEIWTEVLRLEQVGIHDNFFELGGHSLLATQVISRIHAAFQIELPLRLLFEAPTIEDLAKLIQKAMDSGPERPAPKISPVSRGLYRIKLTPISITGSGVFEGKESQDSTMEKEVFIFPTSFAQQRLWFLDQLEPRSTVYNMPVALRLTGPLNVAALEQSLNEIMRRHETLRTTFSVREGQPVQVIDPTSTLVLSVVDLRGLPESERKTEVSRLSAEEAKRPFDLAHGPLLRSILLRLEAQEHVLLLTMHHIVSDGWSMGVLFRELPALYSAFSAGRPSPLPAPPIQYADFAVWQRQWLEGETLQRQLSYWKKQLDGIPPVLELPTDKSRPVFQTFQGGKVSVHLPQPLTQAIRKLSRREGATLFMTLLAAFKTLLYRHTGQDDIVVGSPIAGRSRAEIEPLIGFFVNTLVLRTDLSGNPTFRQVLSRVRSMALDAYAHQDLPFERLVEALRPERTLSHTPLFQVFFNTLNLEIEELKLRSLTVEPIASSAADSKFDLTLYVRERSREIDLTLVYNTYLFCRDRMVEMLEQYKLLLAQIVEKPDENISRFSLVTPRARAILPDPTRALDCEWVEPVHSRFSRQARWTPERAALSSQEGAWSYRDLESRSNQLAHCLISSGIRPGQIVAIYGHRGAALVWALLGILKAGGAFAILDPTYPAQRLIDHVQAAKPRGWIVLEGAGAPPQGLEDAFSATRCRCRLVLPESNGATDHDLLTGCSNSDPGMAVDPDDLAYIAFTSGTAGRPRAIEATHRPLSHFLQWHCRRFDLRECDRFSMLSGLSHDPLLRDIFTPLWLGATLCIPDPNDLSPGRLAEWVNRNEVSVAHLTPAMGELLTSEVEAKGCKNGFLRYVFFGGDVLTKQHLVRMRQFAPSVTCVNFYGATETPQAMACFVVPDQGNLADDDGSANSRGIIPLGQGIEDVQLLVLNPSQQLAGVGEVGEIYIRTPYLAKGYLGDDALTQDRFIPDPFTKVPGDRLYRTGDVGRYLPDGMVEFAGRNDQQVKIRGFRIELGEIESVLGQHAAVREAVVVARDDRATESSTPLREEKRLVAYVVPYQGQALTVDGLRSFLKQKLPEYMVPSAFVFLDALPLTPNGKVDRRALPAPDQSRPELESPFVAPRAPAENTIAEIWAQVLKVDRVGIHDNFFDLGGHSLLATQVVSRIRSAFKVELPLRALFETPTVAGLAVAVTQCQAKTVDYKEIASMLAELESLSDEKAEQLLNGRS